MIEPVFEDWNARQRKFRIVSFHAKRARGLMARFMVRERLTAPEALKEFQNDPDLFRQEVRTTLVHEIGHVRSLEEEQLEARGLA